MKQLAIALSVLFYFVSISEVAAASKLANYEAINLKDDGKTQIIELTFDRPVDAKGVVTEYINQTIQLYIPGSKIDGKKFEDVENSKLKSFYSYQLGKKGIRTRLIYKEPVKASDFKGRIKFSSHKNKLRIEVNHQGVATQLAMSSLPKVVPVDIDDEGRGQELPSILFEVDEKKNFSAQDIVAEELGQEFSGAKVHKVQKASGVSEDSVNQQIDEELAKRGLLEAKETQVAAQSTEKNPIKDLKESEIPVLLGAAAKKEASSPLYRVAMSLGILIAMIGGFVLFGKWWGKHQKKSLGDNHIRVVTQHHLGPKKSIAIIRVAGESILIGVTDNNISMLKTLALIDEEVSDESPEQFESTLNSMAEQEAVANEVQDRITVARQTGDVSEDEFNYGQLKDMVSSKLKKMRTL